MIIEDFVATLEEPVKQAVIVMLQNGEPTGSSGFHHFLNQKWGIVFDEYPSELVIEAARLSGLSLATRGHIRWKYEVCTDVWLDNCEESQRLEAKAVFDRFAEIYMELKSVVRRNEEIRNEQRKRAEAKLRSLTGKVDEHG